MAECRLAEILQYMCNLEFDKKSRKQQLVCTQVPRIFRLCPGRPAVEVTRVADINMATGEVTVSEANLAQIKAKDWINVERYTTTEEE
ncbi:hypothetical protein NMY22_g18250 [Coprinellus aureogranulatus]|nr:hypothetical protein NMY22_g18250 [Coprinellus aureogranulatus]